MRNNVKQNKDHRSSRLVLLSHRQKERLLALMMVGRRPARICFSLDAKLGVGYRPLDGGHDAGIIGQVELVDEKGIRVGVVHRPPSDDEIEFAKARIGSKGSKVTVDELIEKVEAL